jgi:hypothetical protein
MNCSPWVGQAMTGTGKTVTRVDLCEAVYQKVGLSRTESSAFVELVLKEITDCLEILKQRINGNSNGVGGSKAE